MSNHSCTIIDENGVFHASDLEKFMKATGLESCGKDYVVVSIVGPQSSGKSTLLNCLFNTTFKEMDIKRGRQKTSQGISMSKWVGIHHPHIIVMDAEGSDGKERGQENAFEKKITLFALTVSQILLINMWYHDIGRENAASWPLLHPVFEVMMELFPSPPKRTLLFVIRDTDSDASLGVIRSQLMKDIEQVWNAFRKPQEHKNTRYADFLKVEVTFLSHYKHARSKFDEEVAELRKRFINSTAPGGFADHGRVLFSASKFSSRAEGNWKMIESNKKLELLSLNIMDATIRCDEAKEETLLELEKNEDWKKILHDVQYGLVPGCGGTLSDLIDSCLEKYDKATEHLNEKQRLEKRKQLVSMALGIVHPAYKDMLRRISREARTQFEVKFQNIRKSEKKITSSASVFLQGALEEFDRGCADARIRQANWSDHIELRALLQQDIKEEIRLAEEKISRKEGMLRAVEGAVMICTGAVVGILGATGSAHVGATHKLDVTLILGAVNIVYAGYKRMSKGLEQRKIGESFTSSSLAALISVAEKLILEQRKIGETHALLAPLISVAENLIADEVSEELEQRKIGESFTSSSLADEVSEELEQRKIGESSTPALLEPVADEMLQGLEDVKSSTSSLLKKFPTLIISVAEKLIAAGYKRMAEGLEQRKTGKSFPPA